MAGDSVRLEGSKGNDLAKIDFRPKITYPHPPDPLNGFGPMQGERAKLTFRHNEARARWSLKTWSTLTKLSESFNCIMEQSPPNIKVGERVHAPHLEHRSPVVLFGRTDGRTDRRDTLKSHYAITLTLFGKATEVAKNIAQHDSRE